MLVDLNIKDFADRVASHNPVVPAGGSVMALSGLMSVCLVEMSINSACGRSEKEMNEAYFEKTKMELTKLRSELLAYIDKDAEAYGGVLAAYKLPKSTLEEAEQRQNEIQAAALTSIEIPLEISEACILALESGIMLLPQIKHGVLGDLKIGLLVMKAVIEGSLVTAKINLQLLKKDTLKMVLQVRLDKLQARFDTVMTGLR